MLEGNQEKLTIKSRLVWGQMWVTFERVQSISGVCSKLMLSLGELNMEQSQMRFSEFPGCEPGMHSNNATQCSHVKNATGVSFWTFVWQALGEV